MKRLLIYALLGPPLALATGLGILSAWRPFEPSELLGFAVLLPATYFLGLVPGLLAGGLDHHLAERQVRWRLLWVALAGFGVSFIPIVPAVIYGLIAGPGILLLGLVGAVPAALCSLLADAVT